MTSGSLQLRPGRAGRAGRRLQEHWFALLCLGVVLLLARSQSLQGWYPIRGWDWLQHTGAAVFLLALAAARGVPEDVRQVITRLRLHRGEDGDAMTREEKQTCTVEVMSAIGAASRRYGRVGAAVGVGAMAAIWVWAVASRAWSSPLFWLELAGAGVAGWAVGGFVAYGRLGRELGLLHLRPAVVPGHPDDAAGLRPVGSLYIRQATIVAAIGLFAGIWWLIIPYVGHYRLWRDPYLAIVGICLVLETASLFLPLRAFHQIMVDERDRLLPEADAAAERMAVIDDELGTADGEAVAGLESERERLQRRWQAIETMPTWPIDVRIRRRFAWNNVAILVPIVLQWLKAPQLLQQLGSALGQIS